MHFLVETDKSFETNLEELKLASQFWNEAKLQAQEVQVAATDDLAKFYLKESSIYFIQSGNLRLSLNGELIAILEEADLLASQFYFSIPNLKLEADMAIQLLAVEKMEIYRQLSKQESLFERYLEFLEMNSSLLIQVLGTKCGEGLRSSTQIESFSEGETIIREGDSGRDVYHLIEGLADVKVSNVKVGTVQKDEIFGAMAALTGEKRSASVVASSECLAMKIPPEDFLSLIQTKPSTVSSLLKDMATKISELNARVVQATDRRISS